MITILCSLLGFVMVLVLNSLNPVKMSFVLIFMSLTSFFLYYVVASNALLSSIFLMLFVGGILVMFMVLSSLLPNEKQGSPTGLMLVFSVSLTSVFGLNLMSSAQNQGMVMTQSKSIYESDYKFEWFIFLILTYFFSFIYILCAEKFSLRKIN